MKSWGENILLSHQLVYLLVGWTVSPPPKKILYVEFLNPSTSECDYFWRQSFKKVIKFKEDDQGGSYSSMTDTLIKEIRRETHTKGRWYRNTANQRHLGGSVKQLTLDFSSGHEIDPTLGSMLSGGDSAWDSLSHSAPPSTCAFSLISKEIRSFLKIEGKIK